MQEKNSTGSGQAKSQLKSVPKKKEKPRLKKKAPDHRKMRCVFAADKYGRVLSSITIENKEADRVVDIIEAVDELKDKFKKNRIPVNMRGVTKYLRKTWPQRYKNLSRQAVQSTIVKMAGAMWFDIKTDEDQWEVVIPRRSIYINQEIINTKCNLVGVPNYLRAPCYVRPART